MCTSKPKAPPPPPPPAPPVQPAVAPDQGANVVRKKKNTNTGGSAGASTGPLLTGGSGVNTGSLNVGGATLLGGGNG